MTAWKLSALTILAALPTAGAAAAPHLDVSASCERKATKGRVLCDVEFEVPDGREEEAAAVIKRVMSSAAEPAMTLDVPLDVEVGWGEHWGAAH